MADRQDPPQYQAATDRGIVPTDEAGSAFVPTQPILPTSPAWTEPAPSPTPPATLATAPLVLPSAGPVNRAEQSTNVNVTTNVAGPTMVFTHHQTGPGFFIRALWYLFVGWWASAFAIAVAYLALFTFVGIPLAFYLFNRLPTILTLRPRTQPYSARTEGGVTYVELGHERQRRWYQRLAYFLLIGWWFGALWLTFAWAISIFVITLPLTFWMFNRASGVMTLHRH